MKLEIFGTCIEPESLQQLLNLDHPPKKEAPNVLLDDHTWQLIAAGIIFLGGGLVGPILSHELAKRREKAKKLPSIVNVVVSGKFFTEKIDENGIGASNLEKIEKYIQEEASDSDDSVVSIEFEE